MDTKEQLELIEIGLAKLSKENRIKAYQILFKLSKLDQKLDMNQAEPMIRELANMLDKTIV